MSNLIESLEDAKRLILNRMPDSAIDALNDALTLVRATEPVGRIYLITDIPEVEWYTDVWEGALLYTTPKTVVDVNQQLVEALRVCEECLMFIHGGEPLRTDVPLKLAREALLSAGKGGEQP
jgi:hypothetical protein